MTRACRPFPAWLRWAVVVCATALPAPRPAAAQCGGPSFALSPYPAIAQSNAPWAAVTGDFFGPDGMLDVVATLDGSGQVVLLPGNNSGNLAPGVPVTAGVNPRDIVAADFNRDGRLDIAVATSGATSVSLLAGTGTGFGPATTEDLTWSPSRLATGDLDHDGWTDLVVVGEAAGKVRVLRGGVAFTHMADIDLADASAVAVGDFDRNGWGDLAVTQRGGANRVQMYMGSDAGGGVLLLTPGVAVSVGTGPADIAAADVNYDGALDFVTADRGSGTATVRLGDGTGAFPANEVVNSSVPPLVFPIRVAILDFDRDGGLDLALLDEGTSPPQVMVFPGPPGGATPPPPPPSFDTAKPLVVALDAASAPKAFAIGDILKDGRPDLVVPESGLDTVVVVPNTGPPDCPRPSFYEAPRAYLAGEEPVWAAAADFVEDGIEDLVVASKDTLEVLRGTGNGFAGFNTVGIPAAALGIAAADFNFDGHADVVVALGNEVRLYRGDGGGGFPSFVSLSAGTTASAVVAGDFNGDGAPDAAVTSQGSDELHIFIGDGLGGLAEQAESPLATGTGPGALATGDLDGNGTLDIVVANSWSNTVSVYLGDIGGGGVADGTFTAGVTLTVGAGPWGVALAYFNADAILDVVTGDHDASPNPTVTVRLGNGSGGFNTPTTYAVEGVPISVAGLDVTGDGKNDVSVVTGNHTLATLEGVGNGTFLAPKYVPVRPRPSAIVPVDADSDGRKDLAIPCKDADSVVVLLSRPPGFAQAVSIPLTPGASPTDIATADLDADGDLDLVVVNGVAGTVSILVYDQATGTFIPGPTPTLTVGASPEAVAIADLNLDGILDLAVSCTGAGNVELFEGLGGAGFNAKGPVVVGVPDDLVAADFDQDGDPDLAVCSQQSTPGSVAFLRNLGGFVFAPATTTDVGDVPTAIVASDFDLDGRLDVAVANDNSNTLTVLYGDGAGGFASTSTLALVGGDTSPVSVAAGDFDMDGDDDLATVAFGANMLSVFENKRALKFPDPPSRFDATLRPLFVGTGDVNRDGKVDLAIAAEGVRVQAGQGGLTFTSSEDLVAGLVPGALTLGDFNRDGRPDIAVANMASDDVSVLFSTACLARRLVVTTSPAGCGAVGALGTWAVEVQDDAGNVSVCETGNVSAAIVPGTGGGGAVLSGTIPQAAVAGVATFPDLSINLPGARYELEYTLSGLSPAIGRSFSLGATVAITGPLSVCPGTSETYLADPGFDTYQWTIDGTPSDWRQSTQLAQPPLVAGTAYTLGVEARVDTCAPTDSKSVYVGDLNTVTISSGGPFAVCVDCLGGAFDVIDEGGGVASHLWGYRTLSAGTITPLFSETGDTYVLKGTDFPGPGTYYIVATTTPTCGSPVVSNEIMVDVTAAVAGGEAQSLGVTSRGNSTDGENVLQWVNTTAPDQVLIRWNESTPGTSDCVPPLDRFASYDGEFLDTSPLPSAKGIYNHPGRQLDTAYCYSVFVQDMGVWSGGRTVKGLPFDTTSSPVKWAYATGATAVVAPVVAGPGLIAISNDRTVHSLGRGTFGGLWPLAWMPATLPGVAHARSPVVPFLASVAGANALLYVGDDTGAVTAVNADTGQIAWGPVTPAGSTSVRGAPGGVFAQYSGSRDLVLVGSISGSPTVTPSDFYGLDIATGTATDFFNGGGTMGPVMTTPAVDYAGDRVYVASRKLGAGDSVWSIKLSDFTTDWSQDAGDVVTSPVLKNGKVYVGNDAGEVYFLDTTASGAMSAPLDPTLALLPPLDGDVKGFLFPDRRNDDLYFSTENQVWSIRDTGSGLTANWVWTGGGSVEPGIVLHWPQTDYLYVGGKDGKLYQLDFSGGQPTDACVPAPSASTCLYIQLGDGQGRLGAPTLDIGLDPPDVSAGKEMLHVGSEAGVLFAVEVPF